MSNFKSIHGGFQMTFENGLTISVMFRGGNYCEHKMADFYIAKNNMESEGHHDSSDAEIAIWNEDNTWLRFGWDTVEGWLSTNDVAGWITRAAAARDMADLQSTVSLPPDVDDEE